MKVCGRSFPRAVVLALASASLFSGCLLLPHSRGHTYGHHAFIEFWSAEEHGTGLRLAVKDNIDMKGVVTTGGSEYLAKNNPPAAHDAACLAIARARGVRIVGKTNLSEFAIYPSGFNEYYGTPKSPLSHMHRLLPGGSSCGSAVCVALGTADVSLGTDTAGSIRVPAACCGIVGLKTTLGLVPIEGVIPVEPKHLDTIGPLAKDIDGAVQGMDLLENGFTGLYDAAKAAKPSAASIRVGRLKLKGTDSQVDEAIDAALTKAGFQVVPLDDQFRQKWLQAKKDGNAMAAGGVWLSEGRYLTQSGVSARAKTVILAGRLLYPLAYRKALSRREAWQHALHETFKKVDFIALPTLQGAPPGIPPNLKIGITEALMLDYQNTVPVNFAGNPALAVPVPVRHERVKLTSLQLIGPPKSEAGLLNAGRYVEDAVEAHRHREEHE
jgi:Asp-tRNA(Asn)/Glu-tRNA(Gln) amidotransferase A subunit family amidase